MGQGDCLSQEASQAYERSGPMFPGTFRVLWYPPLPRGESNIDHSLPVLSALLFLVIVTAVAIIVILFKSYNPP